MSKMKALLAILLVGAFCMSVAMAAKPKTPPNGEWSVTICHRQKLLTVRNKHRLMAHLHHGDTLPRDGRCR